MARKATPPYRFGIVGIHGAGGMAGIFARVARQNPATRLVAICDLNPAGFDDFRQAFSPVDAYTDAAEMLAAHEIDLIYIASADHTHCDLVEAACRAGVPMILCEKPLDVTLARGERIARAVEESGAAFLCDHTRRWMPTWVRAQKILAEQLGPVVRARAQMGGARAMLYRNGTHLLDTLCWFVGDDPAWLVGAEFEELGVFDPNPSPTALLGFKNGCRAFIDFSKKGPEEFEIDCTCDGARLTVRRDGIHLARQEPGLGMTYTHLPSGSGDSDGYASAARDLIGAYEEGRPTRSTIRDALRGLEVITAIVRSHDGGGARIDWPLDPAAATPSEGQLGLDARTLQWRG
jgi:predicted dehydrogenase